MMGVLIAAVAMCVAGVEPALAASQQSVVIRGAFVRVLDQAEVPASDKGTLQNINVRLGQKVAKGEELARLDDGESRLAVELAKLDVRIAARQADSELLAKVADAHVYEAEQEKKRSTLSQEIAEKKAKDSANVERAMKTRDLAKKSLERGKAARAGYRPSLAEADVEKRQLEYDLSELELQKARLDSAVTQLQARMEMAVVDQFAAVVERLRKEAELARDNQATAKITKEVKDRTLELAELRQQKRRVVSPINGEVAEILRNKGEWVEPGTPIARVIRLDRLRVEGYVKALPRVRQLVGSKVQITSAQDGSLRLIGTVTYVGAEVNSVNNEVQIHVEFDNTRQQLSIGEPVQAVVDPNATGK
ncbi:MAG: HlyD family secretion protein [Planctomycetaceae bacterium]